jgi:hypothetical protein
MFSMRQRAQPAAANDDDPASPVRGEPERWNREPREVVAGIIPQPLAGALGAFWHQRTFHARRGIA